MSFTGDSGEVTFPDYFATSYRAHGNPRKGLLKVDYRGQTLMINSLFYTSLIKVKLSPDGLHLGVVTENSFFIFKTYGGEKVFEEKFGSGSVTKVLIGATNDGKHFFFGHYEERCWYIHAIRIQDFQVVRTIELGFGLESLVFSNDLLHYAFITQFSVTKVSLDCRTIISYLSMRDTHSYAFSPNNKYFIYLNAEGVGICGTETKDVVTKLKTKDASYRSLHQDIDGKIILMLDDSLFSVELNDFTPIPSISLVPLVKKDVKISDGFSGIKSHDVFYKFDRDSSLYTSRLMIDLFDDHHNLDDRISLNTVKEISDGSRSIFLSHSSFTYGFGYLEILEGMPKIRVLFSFQRQLPLIFAYGVLEGIVENLIKNKNKEVIRYLLEVAKGRFFLDRGELINQVSVFI